eukprot:scaffold87951_cov16-Tisochrysis_lutea.AAC.1
MHAYGAIPEVREGHSRKPWPSLGYIHEAPWSVLRASPAQEKGINPQSGSSRLPAQPCVQMNVSLESQMAVLLVGELKQKDLSMPSMNDCHGQPELSFAGAAAALP